jgi:hypothetical protein
MSDATLPVDEAFNPDGLKFITSDGQTLKLWTVGGDIVENNAYINGNMGGVDSRLRLKESTMGLQESAPMHSIQRSHKPLTVTA